MAVWGLVVLVLLKTYEETLLAMMAVPIVEIPVDSLEDLVNQDEYTWKVENGSHVYHYFKEQESGVGKEIYDRLGGTHFQCWPEKEFVRNGDYAVICERMSSRQLLDWDFRVHKECGIYEGSESFLGNLIMATAFTQNSTIKESINQIIDVIVQSGLFNKWLKDEMPFETVCARHPSMDQRGLFVYTLEILKGPFAILAIGMSFSMCAFAYELCFKKKNKISRKK